VSGTPDEVALTLAVGKAEHVAATISGAAVVVGCDSILDLDGEPLGKPRGSDEAIARWHHMRGRTGRLLTGHCVLRTDDQQRATAVVSTSVRFANPSDDEIAAYVATGEPQHVAGAFTIDGFGGWFVEGIDGDHTNVIGISLPRLRGLLSDVGVPVTSLWSRGTPDSRVDP